MGVVVEPVVGQGASCAGKGWARPRTHSQPNATDAAPTPHTTHTTRRYVQKQATRALRVLRKATLRSAAQLRSADPGGELAASGGGRRTSATTPNMDSPVQK